MYLLEICVPNGCFIFLPKNGYEILTVFRQEFFMILVSAVATTASRVAREWNGHRARPARTHVKRWAPQQAVSPANGTDTTRDLHTLHTYSFRRQPSVEHNFFKNPRFFMKLWENLRNAVLQPTATTCVLQAAP